MLCFDYSGLWKLLEKHDLNKKQFCELSGVSIHNIKIMTKGIEVKAYVILQVCEYFKCEVREVVRIYNDFLDAKKAEEERKRKEEERAKNRVGELIYKS